MPTHEPTLRGTPGSLLPDRPRGGRLVGVSPGAPEFPSSTEALGWLGGSLLLYALATVDPRRALAPHPRAHRTCRPRASDCYGLTTVGYMGNNVLPARAGEALRVVLLDARTDAGKRKLAGTIVAERILDAIVLGRDARGRGLRGAARRRASHRPPAADHGGRRGAVRAGAGGRAASCAAAARSPACGTSPVRWPTPTRAIDGPPGRAAAGRVGGALVRARAPSTWRWPRRSSWTSARTGALYLVALTNFVAALPAAPGSIGTFDAAVAFGAKALGGSGLGRDLLPAAPALRPLRADHGGRPRVSWSCATAAGRACARRAAPDSRGLAVA